MLYAAPERLLSAVRMAIRAVNQLCGVEFAISLIKFWAVEIRKSSPESLVFPCRFKEVFVCGNHPEKGVNATPAPPVAVGL